MTDTSGCQPNLNNLAFYLQGVSVQPSSNLTSDYFVTASLPSSASLRRVWQFTTQGTITGPDAATLTLDYTAAHEKCPQYNITFEGALNGSLIVHNQVFSANKFISYEVTSAYVIVLTVRVPKSIQECFGASTTQNYYFNINLNDATGNAASLSFKYTTNASLDATTIYGTDVSGGICTWSSSQQYYYGGAYTDPSGILTYTGYLQIQGVSSSNTCSAPSSLTLDISEFPSGGSGPVVALLGIEFDSSGWEFSTPTTFYLNWTSEYQELSVPSLGSERNYCNGFILVYSSSSGTWTVQSGSADPLYLVTCTLNHNHNSGVNIYDDESNNIIYNSYSSTESSGQQFCSIGLTVPKPNVYISFPFTIPNDYLCPFTTFYDSSGHSDLYLVDPSGNAYQGPLIAPGGREIFLYYCNGTWGRTACS